MEGNIVENQNASSSRRDCLIEVIEEDLKEILVSGGHHQGGKPSVLRAHGSDHTGSEVVSSERNGWFRASFSPDEIGLRIAPERGLIAKPQVHRRILDHGLKVGDEGGLGFGIRFVGLGAGA